jgi:hypothetical protein
LKLVSYNILKGFWFLLEDFWKIICLHGAIFEFPYFLCIKILLNMNSQANVTQSLLYVMASFANYESLEGIVGTASWRVPQVLQALQDVERLVCSKNSDVCNFQMLYYEKF